jgi:perosamine synthetase
MIPHSATTIGPEERTAVDRVLQSGYLSQGSEVSAFEAECAAFTGRRHAVAVSSGTAALHLALAAAGFGGEKRVALPAYACAALTTAVRLAGAIPVLCDVDDSFNLDVASIPPDADAVIAVHLFGAACELPASPVCVEDLAQSLGGAVAAAPVAITSFYATKLITTGEGGMVLTDDAGIADTVRDLRDYDNRGDSALRFNYKLTDIQGAMGRVQLRRLPDFIARRRAIAAAYSEAFAELPLRLPDAPGHVYYRYVVASPVRDALEAHCQSRGVEAKRPVFAPAHHSLGGTFPGADRAHREALSLPIYPSLDEASMDRVIDSVRSFFQRGG